MIPPLIYISGPITGRPNDNREAFAAALAALEAAGYRTINPHDVLEFAPGLTWHDYVRADIKALMDADGVATLPDWEASRGATAKVQIARMLDMPVKPVGDWLDAKDGAR